MSEQLIKLKHLHPAQLQILSEAKRFNVLKCGRRFGKTELTKEIALNILLENNQYVGYWTPTYKDLANVWKEIKYTISPITSKINEQLKQITTITGGVIDFWSMDEPDSGRGRKYHVAIIDEAEKAIHLKQAWEQTIRATLVDYKGSAWFMSTPKFGATYFKMTLFQNENKFDNWKSWRFTSFDNPFLDPKEIEEARKYDELTYRCEYLAEDVDLLGRRFAFAFDREKHIPKVIDPFIWNGTQEQILYLSFDFNRNPITCAVIQHYNGCIYVIEQIKLANSNIYELCNYIKSSYPEYLYMITGDASGKASSALVKDNLNYYTVIQTELRVSINQFKLPAVNPRIEENQVLVNAIFSKYPVFIHPDKGKALIFDLENVQMGNDGKIKKDNRQDETEQADSLDCFRYYLNSFHKNFLQQRHGTEEN